MLLQEIEGHADLVGALVPLNGKNMSFLKEESFSESAGPQSKLAFKVVSHLLRERCPTNVGGTAWS
jgi:hypothetical protein